MSVKIIKKESTLYAIEGELNMQTASEASKQLAAIIKTMSSGTGGLILDLASISRSDSAGVAFLVDAMQLTKTAKRTLLLSNLPRQMKDIASISGLLGILPLGQNQH